jgi:hypothetical protein
LLLLGKNSWHNQLTKRKVLFWFIVWELSVPGCLALLLWACGRQCKAAHLMVKKRKRESRRDQDATAPFKVTPQWPKDLSPGPTSSRFHQEPVVLLWEQGCQHVWHSRSKQ